MSEYPGQNYSGGQGYGDQQDGGDQNAGQQSSGDQYGGDQGGYGYSQGGQSSEPGADDNEDVVIEYEYATEEGIQFSMDELTSAGYEPEPDDSSSGSIA